MSKQTVTIIGNDLNLTEKNIRSFSVDRYSASGNNIEIGSAIAAELTFALDNSSGEFNDKNLEGLEIFVKINGTTDIGYFFIDEAPKKTKIINIKALDRMVRFDKEYDTNLAFPTTVENIIYDCCAKCNMTLATDLTGLPNIGYIVNEKPTVDTFRTVLMWCAEITGKCAFINKDGSLELSWYDTVYDNGITSVDRYTGGKIDKNPIQITGIKYKDLLVGTTGYVVEIINNRLLQGDFSTVLSNIYNAVHPLIYYSYDCEIQNRLNVNPLGKIVFTDDLNNNYNTIITHYNFKLNGRNTVKAVGETNSQKAYGNLTAITPHEQEIIREVEDKTKQSLSLYEKMLTDLNQQTNNALGLYTTEITDIDGRKTIYTHDKSLLEESIYITVKNANGFAWTNDGWNDGSPVWQYGVDKYANAIFNVIATSGLTADWVTAGVLKSANNKVNINLNNGTVNVGNKLIFDGENLSVLLNSGKTTR